MRLCPWLLGTALVIAQPRAAVAQHPVGYFVELGGNGGFGSLNLDLRLAGHLHARAGGGTILWPTIPLTASYVIGNPRSGLEIGGGATVMFFPRENPDEPFVQRFVELVTVGKGVGTVALLTGILGYRHQRASGSVFRLTFTPYFGGGHLASWFGMSFGGAF